MNDDTLTTALDRMTTALEPPHLAEELINTRRAQLRRRRQLATGLGATSVMGLVAATAMVAGSLAGTTTPAPAEAPLASASAATSPASSPAAATDPDVTIECVPTSQGRITLAEALRRLENQTPPPGSLLSMDLEADQPRAWLRRSDGRPLLEMELEKRGEEYSLRAATRCSD